jgi:hypothetical protein
MFWHKKNARASPFFVHQAEEMQELRPGFVYRVEKMQELRPVIKQQIKIARASLLN